MMQQFLYGMEIADNIVYLTTINHYTTKRRIREMKEHHFGIKEIYCVDTPKKPWPQLGFQLAAVHTQRGYERNRLVISTMKNKILFGDCRDTLPTIDVKARMCVTSPPYYGLRNYGGEEIK